VFQWVIDDAKVAAASFIDRYLARVSVAVPFVVALGFATAAMSLALTERFGATTALAIMATIFCVIGLVGGIIVALREQETVAVEEHEREEAGLAELGEMASAAASQAGRLPWGAAVSLLGAQPAIAGAAVRLLARHLPLLVLVAMILLLVWPTEEPEQPSEEEEGLPAERPPAPASTVDSDRLRQAA
jgi:hypothetical protein